MTIFYQIKDLKIIKKITIIIEELVPDLFTIKSIFQSFHYKKKQNSKFLPKPNKNCISRLIDYETMVRYHADLTFVKLLLYLFLIDVKIFCKQIYQILRK